jgi:hypothetical protein
MRRRAALLLWLALAALVSLLAACAADGVAVRPSETPAAPPGLTLLPTETPTATETPGPTETLPLPTPLATATSVIALPPTTTGEAGATPATNATVATPSPTSTALPAITPRPSQTSTALPPTATPSSTPTEGPCVNDATFIEDVTVPDGAQFLPTQPFVKRWRVKNTGTCDWGPGYRLVLVSGDALTALPGVRPQTEFALYPARAGAEAIWEIPMRAPDVPGTYTGRWEARDPQGNRFGALVFVAIEVIPLPTGSP